MNSATEHEEFKPEELAYMEAKVAKLTLMRRMEQVKQDIGKAHLKVAMAAAKLTTRQALRCDTYIARSGGDING